MKLYQEIELKKSEFNISYKNYLLFLGSCFANNIGEKFEQVKFKCSVNPFGVVFNPHSVFDSLDRIVTNKKFTEQDFFEDKEGFFLSLLLHSSHIFKNRSEAILKMNNITDKLHQDIKTENSIVFLTFGTSEVFRYKKTGLICANCHKLSADEFSKQAMSIEKIVDEGKLVISKLKNINPSARIILNISPVRYFSEGAFGNSVSKSRIFCAIEELLKIENVSYFPSYEIVIDQLRDYRFFDKDLAHPNQIAIDWIWEQIIKHYFDKNTIEKQNKIEKLLKNLEHKPLNPDNKKHLELVEKSLDELKKLLE